LKIFVNAALTTAAIQYIRPYLQGKELNTDQSKICSHVEIFSYCQFIEANGNLE